jgi:hypothetical protein
MSHVTPTSHVRLHYTRVKIDENNLKITINFPSQTPLLLLNFRPFIINKTVVTAAYTHKALDNLLTALTNLFRKIFGHDTLIACKKDDGTRCYIPKTIFNKALDLFKTEMKQVRGRLLPISLTPYPKHYLDRLANLRLYLTFASTTPLPRTQDVLFSINKHFVVNAYTHKKLDHFLTSLANSYRKLVGYDTLVACETQDDFCFKRCYIPKKIFDMGRDLYLKRNRGMTPLRPIFESASSQTSSTDSTG